MCDFEGSGQLELKRKKEQEELQTTTVTTNVGAFGDFLSRYEPQSMDQILQGKQMALERTRLVEIESKRRSLVGREAPKQHTIALVPEQEIQPPAAPEMDEKDLKKLRKKEAAMLKKGRKLTEGATKDTVGMINESKPLFTQKAKLAEEKLLSDCTEEDVEEFKESVLTKQLDAKLFEPAYAGEHFRELLNLQTDFDRFHALFQEESPNFIDLQESEKIKIRFYRDEVRDRIRAAVETAAAAHGLKLTANGYVGMSESELAQRRDADDSARELGEFFGQMNAEKDTRIQARAEERIHAAMQEREQEYQALRQDMKQDPETSFIKSEVLNNPYQYEMLTDVRKLIDGKPEEYRANKEVIDGFAKQIFDLAEAIAVTAHRSQAITMLQYEREVTSDKEMWDSVNLLSQKSQKEYTLLLTRASAMVSGIKYILQGKQLGDGDAAILAEYGWLPAEYQNKKLEVVAGAGYYADIYHTKQKLLEETAERLYPTEKTKLSTGVNGRAMMLMREGDPAYNESVVHLLMHQEQLKSMHEDGDAKLAMQEQVYEEARVLAEPKFRQIMDFDLDRLNAVTDEELIAMQPELWELSMAGMMIVDLGKIKNTADPPESIKAQFVGDRGDDFALHCDMLYNYAQKARGLALQRADRNGVLDSSMLIRSERQSKLSRYEGDEQKQMTSFATVFVQQADSHIVGAVDKYFENAERKRQVIGRTETEGFLPSTNGKDELALEVWKRVEALRTRNKQSDTIVNPQVIYQEAYFRCEGEEAEVRKKLAEGGDLPQEEREALQQQAEHLREVKEFIPIMYRVQSDSYHIVGDEKNIGEAMFRSFSRFDQYPSVRRMSKEEHWQMLEDLSAGAFLTKESPQEQIEEAVQRNKQGIRKRFDLMAEQYEYLERKYGLSVPDTYFIHTHYSEVLKDFADIQVDYHLVDRNIGDVLDMKNEQDLRLYHRVQYFNMVGMASLNMLYGQQLMMQKNVNTAQAKELAQKVIEGEVKESIDYLRQAGVRTQGVRWSEPYDPPKE